MDQLSIALVGCGIWGEVILRDLIKLGASVHVCDTDAGRQDVARRNGATATYTSLSSLPAVDGVIVATPATTHTDVVLTLDELGNESPIFVEKPLTETTEDAQILVHRNGPPIFVMHIWTYHPGVRKLKKLIDSDLIGKPTMIRSTRANWTSPRIDVDALSNLAIHDLSIYQFLLGKIPKPRFAVFEKLDNKIVGCIASLEDEAGPNCVLEVSNRYGEKRREVRVHGEYGVLVLLDDISGRVFLIKGGGHVVPEKVDEYPYESVSALETELDSFMNCIENNEFESLIDVENGAKLVRVIEDIRSMAFQ